MRRRTRVQIAVATLSGNSLRQIVHTHCASVHQAAKLVAALLRVAIVNASLAKSTGSLPPGLWLTSLAGWLPRTGICSGTLRSVIEYGLPLPFYCFSNCFSFVPIKRGVSRDARLILNFIGSAGSLSCRAMRSRYYIPCVITSLQQLDAGQSSQWRRQTTKLNGALKEHHYWP